MNAAARAGEILGAGLPAAQQHGPGGAAHLVLLAGVVIAGLVVLGVSRWRRRRDAAAAEREQSEHDLDAEAAPRSPQKE